MTRPVVVSCEHATAAIPARYRAVFRGAERALRSHRGHDLGALALARQIARTFRVRPIEARASRLLADPNRSLGHRRLFSEWSRRLGREEREALLARYWRSHREAVEGAVRRAGLGAGRAKSARPVLHLSVHSFTPVWDGVPREVDVALLYDPARPRERAFAARWLAGLGADRPDLRLRRNHPYRGTADGLTTHLRRVFGPGRYLGIELEVSHAHVLGPAAAWRRLRADVCRSLDRAARESGILASRVPR